MGQNVRADFGIFGTFIYRQTTPPPRRQANGAIKQTIHWLPNTTGAGAANASHMVTADIPIKPGTLTIDLSGFLDVNGDPVSWSFLKSVILRHEASSAATATVKMTGSSLPGLRCSDLLKGQIAVPLFDPSGDGIAVVAPNSTIVVSNMDTVNIATVTLLMQGQIGSD